MDGQALVVLADTQEHLVTQARLELLVGQAHQASLVTRA